TTSRSANLTIAGQTFAVTQAAAAAASSNWAMAIGGTGADMGYSVATDTNGNLIVAGYFSGTVNFGSGALTSAGGQDIFVAKYSPSGTCLWAARFGGSGDDEALGVAVDSSNGDVAVT